MKKIIAILAFTAAMASLFLPWAVISAYPYKGHELTGISAYSYSALAMILVSCALVLFRDSRMFSRSSLFFAVLSLAIIAWVGFSIHQDFGGQDRFLWGFMVFVASLVVQSLNAGCATMCNKNKNKKGETENGG